MLEIRSGNQAAVRTVICADDVDPARVIREARRERDNFTRRLSRMRRTPEKRALDREYYRAYGVRNKAKRDAQKRLWREENRPAYNAYFRRYDQVTPGRKEYKARKAREYRARDRAARASA